MNISGNVLNFVEQLKLSSNEKLDLQQKFVYEHAYYFSFKVIQNKLNDFESRSRQFSHLNRNRISFFSSNKFHLDLFHYIPLAIDLAPLNS